MRTSDLKKMLISARDRAELDAALLAGSDNPQVVATKRDMDTRAMIFDAVINAINGRPAMLQILAEH